MGGGGGGGRARVYFKWNELGRCKGEIDLFIGHWWLKTLWNDSKSTPQVFIQHHETWQHTQLTTGHPWRHEYVPQNARADNQRAKKMQPAEADQLSQALSDTEI